MLRKTFSLLLVLSVSITLLSPMSFAEAETNLSGNAEEPIVALNVGDVISGKKKLIITFNDDASEFIADQILEELISDRSSIEDLGGKSYAVLVSGGVSSEALERLFVNPNIKYIEEDFPLYLKYSNDPLLGSFSNWGVRGPEADGIFVGERFGANAVGAWKKGHTGSKAVYVAVLDSGIDIDHPDLKNNIWVNSREIPGDGIDNDRNGYVDDYRGWNTVGENGNVFPSSTLDSHGTKVAGIIGAEGNNAVGLAGVNWAVGVVPVKMFDLGSSSTSAAIKAINYAKDLKLKNKVNIAAINASWGGGGFSYAMRDAIRYAGDQGIVFVASAGNEGNNNDSTIHYPSNYECGWFYREWDCVVAVAAHDRQGAKAGFSNYGKKNVDLSAPGQSVLTTDTGGRYFNFSGTSAAAPFVTAAVALCAATNPSVPPEKIREIILDTSQEISSMQNIVLTNGMLNIDATIERCKNPSNNFGSIESFRQVNTDFLEVQGWVSSPLNSSLNIRLTANKQELGSPSTIGSRPSFSTVKTSFSGIFNVSAGLNEVCLFDGSLLLSCRKFYVVDSKNPVGEVVPRKKTNGVWRLAGWALDPLSNDSATVSLYVNGVLRETRLAKQTGDFFPFSTYVGRGNDRDFWFEWTAPPGMNEACVVSTSNDGLRTTEIGCFSHRQLEQNDPIGVLEKVDFSDPKFIKFTGWAFDPDEDSLTQVQVYVKDVFAGEFLTDVPREDVSLIYPGHFLPPGFEFNIEIPSNMRGGTFCAVVVNKDVGSNTILGCVAGSPLNDSISGILEVVKVVRPEFVKVQGWATSFAGDVEVEVYANDKLHSLHKAAPRFELELRVPGSTTKICVFAKSNVSQVRKSLGCKSVSLPYGNPFGSFDVGVQHGPRTARVTGWGIDPDTVEPIEIQIYINGRFSSSHIANKVRSDVGAARPEYGSIHGYDVLVGGLAPGNNIMCVFAVNYGVGSSNTLLGCKNVNIRTGNPFGSFDRLQQVSGTSLTVSGWAIDPDIVSSIQVHVYINGVFRGSGTANSIRSDVGRAYPGYGNNHGYSFNVNGYRGVNNVCVYAINRGAGNTNPLLGCRRISL